MAIRYGVPILLIVQAALLLNLSWVTSHNRTEDGHIGAAVYFWKTGRFDVFCVNPPLARILCGLPITLSSPNYDWKSYSPRPQDRSEWSVGSAFIQANDEDHVRLYFFLARAALIPLILLGGWFGYRFASELYGRASGVVFLTLWTFSPLILGWGATICPDMAASALGVIGLYYFWHWLKRPEWGSVIVAGISLGLMPLTKMTWVIAFPLYVVLWAIWRVSLWKSAEIKRPPLKQLVSLLLVGLYVINMGYAFDGSFRPLGKFTFLSATLTGHETEKSATKSGNRFAESWLKKIPVPLPADFIQGLDTQKVDFERGMESYLNGESSERGWKSYYLYVLLYKEPVGTLALGALVLLMTLRAWGQRNRNGLNAAFRDEMIPVFTALALFVFISLQDGISIHPRYILPAIPFAYIFIAKTGRVFTNQKKVGMALVTLFLLASVASSLSQYPHSISYFNEIAGGIKNGPSHLLGSNADWGQSTYFLRDWCRKNADKKVYIPSISKSHIERLKIDNAECWQYDVSKSEKTVLEPGYYALSAADIFEGSERFAPFRTREPIKRIGASIWIYSIESPAALDAKVEEKE